VIVRVATEGQYELEDADVERFDELDHKAVACCADDDEQGFHAAFNELLEFVRTTGHIVDDDHLGGSDMILPPPDVTLEEAKAEFQGEGLLPS
jgi:hypothetical protein